MAFPDLSWNRGGDDWNVNFISSEKVGVLWNFKSFLRECQVEGNELRSYNFGFAGATWNLFTSFDQQRVHSLFGINVKPHKCLEADFHIYCNFYVRDPSCREIKSIECKFKCESAASHKIVENFLSKSELDLFLHWGTFIACSITIKDSSVKEHGQKYLLEKEDEGIPMKSFEIKLFEDYKNLLLSGEGSDVTLQVQDQQFKAHRSILMARSSVFASMFRHDMKENTTGVVDIEDCEPSSFPVLLEFMYYGGTENLTVENVFGLYTSSDKYDVQDLKVKCLQFIRSHLSVVTFCKTLLLSLEHSERDLLKFATEFFIRNFQEIILTAKWQNFISEHPIQANELFIKASRSM